MELAPAIERLKALAHLKGAGRYGELAASLLARIGPLIGKPCAGPSIQLAAEPELPVYVRFPKLMRVRFRKLAPGEPLRRMLAHFAKHPQAQTMHQIAVGTGLIRKSVQNVLTAGDTFQRDGVDPLLWSPKH